MNAAELASLLEHFSDAYTVFALRKTVNETLVPGDELAPSRRWWEGEPVFFHCWITEEEAGQYEAKGYTVYPDRDAWCYHNLSYMLESNFDHIMAVDENAYMMEKGTCGIRVTPDNVERAIELIAKYAGDQLVLIAGQGGEDGYDKGEVIIPQARVLAVWRN